MQGIIYCIENTVNGHKYIGQTIRTLERRIGEHFSSFDKEYNKNRALYCAINKYGKENFISSKIDKAETQEELDTKETYWIKKENSFLGKGYNMTAGGQVEKYNHSNQEISDKLSETLGGKEFMIFDIEGNYIRSTTSQTLFCDEIGCCTASVNNCLKGKKTMLKGYFLIFTHEFSEEKLKEIMARYEKGRKSHEFVLFDEKDNLIGRWDTENSCYKELDTSRNYLHNCLINNNEHKRKTQQKINYNAYYIENCPEYLCIKMKDYEEVL